MEIYYVQNIHFQKLLNGTRVVNNESAHKASVLDSTKPIYEMTQLVYINSILLQIMYSYPQTKF